MTSKLLGKVLVKYVKNLYSSRFFHKDNTQTVFLIMMTQ